MPADGRGIGSRVVLSVEVLAVISAGRLVPLPLDVGDCPKLVGNREILRTVGLDLGIRKELGIKPAGAA